MPNTWSIVGIAFVLTILYGIYYQYQYRSEHKAFEDFKVNVKAKGEAAQILADKQKAEDIIKKERADADNKTATDKLNNDLKRLRLANSNSNILPASRSGSKSPQLSCFGRAELDAALRSFIDETEVITGEGEQAALDLSTARKWAQNR